ncbi:MAG: thioredoxin family protein [Actinomycetota bacterium]
MWWEGCPSTDKAHELLRDALAGEGLDPDVVELVEIETDADAERERFVGSPTIRIGGVEVAPTQDEPVGLSCRIYRLRNGRVSPTPDPEDIREAIREATS